MQSTDGHTFELHSDVTRTPVRFRNRYGIELAGELYAPANQSRPLPALAVSGPFGAVKEQASGHYANELAHRGFVALAFDPSFTGESGGEVRDVASPDIFTEDFSAAVDHLVTRNDVDADRIGVQAICGLASMAITAATGDSRIKAVATSSMYDMARSISRSLQDAYTPEQRAKVVDHISQQRTLDARSGTVTRGLHEIPFDENGNIVTREKLFPNELPADADPVTRAFFDYYRTDRGFAERSINSTSAWTATTPMPFFEFSLMEHLDLLGERQVLLAAGERAHSLYYSEDVHRKAPDNTELVIIPGVDHVDLYDQDDLIPYDKIVDFFTT